jgi:hypothetical protein
MDGIILACPAYLKEVDATGFSSHGLVVMGGLASPVLGNANGAEFHNCIASNNGKNGFYLIGNDANSCLLSGCRAFGNREWGFYDDGLLGNTYLACETDSNILGGYYAERTKPNRSLYVGCYAEGNQHPCWKLSTRCMRVGSLGALEDDFGGTAGTSFSALPRGAAYFSQDVVVADTASVAEALSGGAYTQMKNGSIQLLTRNGALPLEISGTLALGYTDIVSNHIPSIRFPNAHVPGNIEIGRPYFPYGLSIGGTGRSAIAGAGTAPPTTGAYEIGAIWLHDLPVAGGNIGWVCVTPGTPGTWKTFGAISA